MAPSPFRRRKAAKTVRNLAIAEAALALAKDRVGRGSRRGRGGLLLIGGALAAAGTAALLKRDKIAGLLPSRSGEPEPVAPTPPPPSDYGAPGPVTPTATPTPAPAPTATPIPAPAPGGGSETRDQAEAERADTAADRDAEGGERQIEQAGEPETGPLVSEEQGETPGGGISGRPFSGLEQDEESGAGSGESQTWSGRSDNP